jgi:negative regulator of flagellin synthesis FlgM
MRIDLNFGSVESFQTGSTRGGEGSKNVRQSAEKHDVAVLSSAESNVAKLTTAALAVPDVRQERVAELRNSINNGTYSVEPGVLADAILNDLF